MNKDRLRHRHRHRDGRRRSLSLPLLSSIDYEKHADVPGPEKRNFLLCRGTQFELEMSTTRRASPASSSSSSSCVAGISISGVCSRDRKRKMTYVNVRECISNLSNAGRAGPGADVCCHNCAPVFVPSSVRRIVLPERTNSIWK